MARETPELEIDLDWVEREVALVARQGDQKLRAFVKDTTQRLQASRTHFERIHSGKPIGNNLLIMQLHFFILEKIGRGDPGPM